MLLYKKYLLNLSIGLALTALGVALHIGRVTSGGWILVLADAFTVSAVVLLGTLALRLISRVGFFDLFFYTSRMVGGFFYPRISVSGIEYYDYRRKRRERGTTLIPLGVTSLVFCLLALLFTLLFYLRFA